MNISAYAIKRPIPFIVLFIALSVAGLLAFKSLPIREYPAMDYPMVTIDFTWPGATPQQVELSATRKIEDSLNGINGIKSVTSHIYSGSAHTEIELELDSNLEQILAQVKDVVAKLKPELPAGSQDPQVNKVIISDTPLLSYVLTNSGDPADASQKIDNEISQLLLTIPGVAKVSRQGGVDREIQILVDPFKLNSLGLGLTELNLTLAEILRHDTANGKAEQIAHQPTLALQPAINSFDQLSQLQLIGSKNQVVHLQDIAQIRDTSDNLKEIAYYNGEAVIGLQIFANTHASLVPLAAQIRTSIANYNLQHPQQQLIEVADDVKYITKAYHAALQALGEGCILAILTIYLFLRNWRATIIAAIAIPLSIIPTCLVMEWLGYSLNIISLLALSLVSGILVDDAIVEIENIEHHLQLAATTQQQPNLHQITINATAEIGLAVIATSLALVAVFLPTSFMGGVSGRFFRQFGICAAVAVLSSLAVARLLTPLICARWFQSNQPLPSTSQPLKLRAYYQRLLTWCLAHPKHVLSTAIATLLLSLALVYILPNSFFPLTATNRIWLHLQLADELTNQDAVRVMQQANQFAHSYPQVSSVYANLRASEGSAAEPQLHNANIVIKLKSATIAPDQLQQLKLDLSRKLQEIVGVKVGNSNNERSNYYSLILLSSDNDLLQQTATTIQQAIQKLPEVISVGTNQDTITPTIAIIPNLITSAYYGITPLALANHLHLSTVGDYANNLVKLTLGSKDVPVRVKLDNHSSKDLVHLGGLRIPSASGFIPLANLAQLKLTNQPGQLTRYNHQYSVNLTVAGRWSNLGDMDQNISKLAVLQHLPPGVTRIAGGQMAEMHQMYSDFGLAFVCGIGVVYLILAILFNNLKHPLTILSAIPLAASGALASLATGGFSLTMASLLGVLLLLGIVTKNSILVVDMALQLQPHQPRQQAIINACLKRARPILMTSAAMIAGMLPLALSESNNASFNQPLAVCVIGGMISSTMLSLFVVPVIYDLIDQLSWKKQLPSHS